MTQKSPEKFLIHNQDELKTHLSLDFDISIPEFQKEIELTREELDELKRKIIENRENHNEIEKILKKITIDKAKKTLDTEETTVAWLTWVKTEQLKDDVSKQKESKEIQTKLVDSQNAEIASIDVTKWIDIQKKPIETLEIGLALLIQKLALTWVKKEDLKDYTKLKGIFTQNIDKLDSGMQAVWNKMIEIFDNSISPLQTYFVSKWPKIIDTALSQVSDVKEIANYTASNINIPEWNKLLEFATKHPVVAWVAAIAWIYWIFKFFWSLFWWDEDKKSNESKDGKWFLDFLWNWKWLIGWVLGMFGLWQFVWLEDVKKFFKDKLNFDIDDNRLLKAIECFSKWDFIDWFKVLFLWTDSLSNKPKKPDEFYQKVAEEISKKEYVKKNIRGWIDRKVIKKFWWDLTNDFLGLWDSSIRFFESLVWRNKEQNLHINALKDYLKDMKETKKLDIKENDTVEFTLGQIMWEADDSTWDTKTTWDTESENKDNQVWWENIDSAKVEEAKKWPWIASALAWENWTWKDRVLASRVLEYAWKSMYYDSLYNKYLKYNSMDVWWTRINKMKAIYKYGTFWADWSLHKIIQIEEKWWLQKLLAELQESSDPKRIKAIKKEIDLFLSAHKRFERDFDNYVRKSKIKWWILNENIDNIDEFNKLKEEEIKLWNEIHETSKQFDDEINELRKTETDPKELSKKEALIRKRYSDAIDWPNWKKVELRKIQKDMMSNLEIISNTDSVEAKEFYNTNKNRIKKSKLPWWKIWLALMWIIVWSIALQWVKDKERLALMWAEAVWGFIPFVNMWLDIKQIINWKDLAWGDLAWWERFWLAPAFLVLDTVWSLATATWIWSAIWIPILVGSNALKWAKWARLLKTSKDAIKVAEWAHTAEWIAKQTKVLEEFRNLWINLIWWARDISKVPGDFISKYREWMQLAYSSWWLKTVWPLATVSKMAIYWWLWYSVYTWIWEVWSVVIDKVSWLTSKISPVLDIAKTVM